MKKVICIVLAVIVAAGGVFSGLYFSDQIGSFIDDASKEIIAFFSPDSSSAKEAPAEPNAQKETAANQNIMPQQNKTTAEMPTAAPTQPPTEAETIPASYMIEGVTVHPQVEFKAGCETYACTMLLESLGFDITERMFMENYLVIRYPSYGDDGTMYAPSMYSSQVGDIYGGWGVYCTAMAKYMNNFLKDAGSDMTATALENVPLPELCEKYVSKGIPVMVWGTVEMLDPYPRFTWTVDYVEEDDPHYKVGDTFTWLQHEHCLVLIGYDEENYYFADSCAGKVSIFEREVSADRYEKIGMQAIVVM